MSESVINVIKVSESDILDRKWHSRQKVTVLTESDEKTCWETVFWKCRKWQEVQKVLKVSLMLLPDGHPFNTFCHFPHLLTKRPALGRVTSGCNQTDYNSIGCPGPWDTSRYKPIIVTHSDSLWRVSLPDYTFNPKGNGDNSQEKEQQLCAELPLSVGVTARTVTDVDGMTAGGVHMVTVTYMVYTEWCTQGSVYQGGYRAGYTTTGYPAQHQQVTTRIVTAALPGLPG